MSVLNTALGILLISSSLSIASDDQSSENSIRDSHAIVSISGEGISPVIAMTSSRMKPPVIAMTSSRMKPPVIAMTSSRMTRPVVATVSGKMKPPLLA